MPKLPPHRPRAADDAARSSPTRRSCVSGLRPLVGVFLVFAGLTGSVDIARAQCTSNASSCVSCHEVRGAHPVLDDGRPWHADHAFGDLCTGCHGGDPEAEAKAAAHSAMRDPMIEARQSCAGCHAQDFVERSARYRAVALPGTPPYEAVALPGTRRPAGPPSPVAPVSVHRAIGETMRAPSVANRALAALAIVLAVLLTLVVARDRGAISPVRFGNWLRARSWSPTVAGAWLGVSVWISEVAFGRPIAASGAFDSLAAYFGRALFPQSPYYAYLMRPGITWQVRLILGALLGSFLSAELAGVARWRWLPDTQWTERFGTRRSVRLLIGFLGAVCMQVGAGIAGGCTSGLAISGGALLSPGAFVFMAGMFIGGIPTAHSWALLAKGRRALFAERGREKT